MLAPLVLALSTRSVRDLCQADRRWRFFLTAAPWHRWTKDVFANILVANDIDRFVDMGFTSTARKLVIVLLGIERGDPHGVVPISPFI